MRKKLHPDVIRMVRDKEYYEVMAALVLADEARRSAESQLRAFRARERDRVRGPQLVKNRGPRDL